MNDGRRFMFQSPSGGPTVTPPAVDKATGGTINFRRATTPRTSISIQTTNTLTTSTQNIIQNIEGTGYMTAVGLEVISTTSANAAAVAYAADAPYNVLNSVIMSDPNGDSINLPGFDLFVANLYGGWSPLGKRVSDSLDTNVYFLTSGAVGAGGSFRFQLYVPIALNRRNFLGALGNQDRSIKYQLRTDLEASGNVYTTPPTTLGSLVINRTYESITRPQRVNSQGITQQQDPPKWGVQHFLTRQINPTVPVGGSIVPHYLGRLGNTIRGLYLILRSNGSRATAESNLPTRIQLLIGDTPIFTESVQYRRWQMWLHFGFDALPGVIAYDWQSDILNFAAAELGMDWLWTAGLVNCQLQITYPAGFGSTNNSLVIVTDDLIVPDRVNVYAAD
jgi:hypothetical protein